MTLKNILTLTFILFLVSFTLVSIMACESSDDDDDDDDDNDDGGDDDDDGRIDGVPDEVNDFLDQADIDKLENAGIPIYTGNNPPNIEGLFALDSLLITYDEIGFEGMTVGYYEITYYDQTSAGEIKQDYEATALGDTGYGIGAFISGDGDCFTVFINSVGDINGCQYVFPAIHSGCVSAEGILEYHWGLLMKEKTGTNCESLMPEDAARILEESDGLASSLQ